MDPLHECVVFGILVAFYGGIGAAVWLIFCSARFRDVGQLNGILALRPADQTDSGKTDDLDFILRTLEGEGRISREFSHRLRRIAPVLHHGRWVTYPSNAYWDFRYQKIISSKRG